LPFKNRVYSYSKKSLAREREGGKYLSGKADQDFGFLLEPVSTDKKKRRTKYETCNVRLVRECRLRNRDRVVRTGRGGTWKRGA